MEQQQLLLFPDKTYNEANCSWTQVIKTHHLLRNRFRSYDKNQRYNGTQIKGYGKKQT